LSIAAMSPCVPEPRSVVILIDNTPTSIDGDFFPTRLEAQKLTVERYAQYLFSVSSSSQIALATLSSTQFGARVSFTSACPRLTAALASVSSSAGAIRLAAAVRWGVMALRHSPPAMRRILAFVGSAHDIVDQRIASEVSRLLMDAGVFLDVVVMGPDVDHVPLLRDIGGAGSVFLEVRESGTVLSDDVLASEIGPGPNSSIEVTEYAKADPDFAHALSMSIEPARSARQSSLGMLLESGAVAARRPRAAKITRVTKPAKDSERDPAADPSAKREKK
jgi:26S proteasome regulatory subunit N10